MPLPDGVIDRTKKYEELVLWPYLDAADDANVTIGYGHLVKDPDVFKALPLVAMDLETSVDEPERLAAWNKIHGMIPDQNDRDREHKHPAAFYKTATTVRLKEEDAISQLTTDLDDSVRALKAQFPAYDSFPDPAKAALIDLMFNIGAGKFVLAKWPALFAAVWAVPPNWKVAAAESSRKPPVPADRNQAIKQLFEDAARIQAS